MLEQSYGLSFSLKSPKNKLQTNRSVYVRISVDGVAKETSTKRRWELSRWNQKEERAVGIKVDARELNFFLDSLTTKINSYRTELINQEKEISAIDLIDYVNGKYKRRNKVLEEFQEHNNEIADLVKKGEYAEGTLERYQTACSHFKEFIKFKFDRDDLTFASLNYEFIKNYNHYLRTKRACSNNTSLKYISNFKKIVLRAVAKDIIPKDPFKLFSGKKTKVKKKPLTKMELQRIEEKVFSSNRLSVVRDVSVFQCYTGLAYIVLCLSGTYLIAEVIGGIMTQSLALLADAAHMLTDVVGLLLAFMAIKIGEKKADSKKTFRYYRTEILAAVIIR